MGCYWIRLGGAGNVSFRSRRISRARRKGSLTVIPHFARWTSSAGVLIAQRRAVSRSPCEQRDLDDSHAILLVISDEKLTSGLCASAKYICHKLASASSIALYIKRWKQKGPSRL